MLEGEFAIQRDRSSLEKGANRNLMKKTGLFLVGMKSSYCWLQTDGGSIQ